MQLIVNYFELTHSNFSGFLSLAIITTKLTLQISEVKGELKVLKLSSEEVNGIALESRLLLSEAELAGAVRYINNFLDMLDRFRELDLKDVVPFSFAEALECPLRDDTVVAFPYTEAILHESEHVDGSYFKVPRIMEE